MVVDMCCADELMLAAKRAKALRMKQIEVSCSRCGERYLICKGVKRLPCKKNSMEKGRVLIDMEHFVSASCRGVHCRICGDPATHKVGEEIMHDDPMPNRHNFTAYVCCDCFVMIVGPAPHRFLGCPEGRSPGKHSEEGETHH